LEGCGHDILELLYQHSPDGSGRNHENLIRPTADMSDGEYKCYCYGIS